MKKILKILITIFLIIINTTVLISCKKINNIESEKENNNIFWIPQKPQKNSNWKLMPLDKLNFIKDNKWYIGIMKNKENDNFFVKKFNFSNKSIWDNSGVPYHIINGIWYIFKSYYYWTGFNKPKTPEINKNNGKIIDWKE